MRAPHNYLRAKWRQLRWSWAAYRTRQDPLREFVYLDEASVVSLLASRLGPLAEQITESASTTRGSEFGLTGSFTTGGSPKPSGQLGTAAKLTSSDMRGSSTVRKASAQSNFRELYKYERRRIVNLRSKRNGLVQDVDGETASQLKRGNLVELDVELEADPSFAANLVLSEVALMIGPDAEEFGIASSDLNKLSAVNRIIGRLQVGLVPVRARVVGYTHLQSSVAGVRHVPIYLVGLTNSDGYWQDTRTALFSKRQYTLLARLSGDGFEEEWSPNKLLTVLESRAPQLARAIGQVSTLDFGDVGDDDSELPANGINEALEIYVESALRDHGKLGEEITYSPAIDRTTGETVDLRRKAFAEADEFLATFGVVLDRDEAAAARESALQQAGVVRDLGSVAPASSSARSDTDFQQLRGSTSGPTPVYLDAEIVAIYW